MECQYCKSNFKTNSSLNNHQKTAKYCLSLQGSESKKKFECEDCNAIFTLKSTLEKHQTRCVYNLPDIKKLKQQISLLRQQVISLQSDKLNLQSDKLDLQERYDHLAETLAKRSTITTTNNTINNIMNMSVFDKSEDDINKIVEEKYDKNYLIQGQKGVARFTSMYVLKSDDKTKPPIYLITDKSRGNGKYKVSESEMVTDIGMSGLTKKVQPSIKKKAINIAAIEPNFIVNEHLFDGYQEVFDMEDDNGIFRKELVRILEQVE
jgi:hypothetical protein